MFRLLGYLILTIIGITLIRMVVGVIGKLFSSAMSGDDTKQQRQSRQTQVPAGGVLHKDPVCGTFVPEQGARKLAAGGQTHYFCSDQCLREFREGSSKRA